MSIQCPSNQTVVAGDLTDHAAASPPDGGSSRCSYCHQLRWPARDYALPPSSHVGHREASRPCDEYSERLPCSTDNADGRPLQSPLDRLRTLPAPLPRHLPMTVTTSQASSPLVSWTLLPMTTPPRSHQLMSSFACPLIWSMVP